LALDAVAQSNVVKVYPNPCNNNCNIEIKSTLTENVQINLYDVRGILVKNIFANKILQSGSNVLEIEMNVPAGIYYAKAFGKNNSYTIKIIKQ
jgi:hypothetical protein